jgi:hypothetical protein
MFVLTKRACIYNTNLLTIGLGLIQISGLRFLPVESNLQWQPKRKRTRKMARMAVGGAGDVERVEGKAGVGQKS